MNVVYAIRAAQMDIAEVCVVLGPHVLRGTRVKKVDQSILQTFDTPNFPPLADFSVEVELHPWRTVRRKRTLVCRPTFQQNIITLTLHPGMSEQAVEHILQADPAGIIIRAYGPGMVPKSMFPWLKKATNKDIPVVFTSQTIRGRVDLHRYRKQLTLEELGVISAKDMTTECTTVKLMWALTQARNHRRLRELMERNLVGEVE